MSEKNGVQPVTSALAGSAARRSSIRSGVRSSVGPKAGSAVMIESSPSGVVTTGSTPAMRSSARSVATASSAPPAAEVGTTTVSGPFAPGPNSAATRSYAWRVVLPAGWLLASPGQVRRSSTGAASTSRTPRLTSAQHERLAADAGGPAGGERLAGAQRTVAAYGAGQQLATTQPAQRRHEGEGGRGDEHDGDGGGQAERVVRRQAGEAQAHQRDQHGHRGEHHRSSGRRDRAAGGLDRVVPEAEVLHVARDQEQRVVDPDAEPDHRGDHRGGRAHRPSSRRAGRCPSCPPPARRRPRRSAARRRRRSRGR